MNTKCLDCKKPRKDWPANRRSARGLCIPCYRRRQLDDTLDERPRHTWPVDDLLDEWVFLRETGVHAQEAATRLGMTFSAFEQAMFRARRRGDTRATGFSRVRT